MAAAKNIMSLEQYLEKVGRFAGNEYGKQIRSQFADSKGNSELAMLQSPSFDEMQQLTRAVAIMTPSEKAGADKLSDEQVRSIAKDAKVDEALFAIFINGYALALCP
ncbi:MAG: hypothetical protein KAS23_08560 [Anaerohalosphaera sp.]|nr:hypothetical protein [Anaerohalosphaera sp.]